MEIKELAGAIEIIRKNCYPASAEVADALETLIEVSQSLLKIEGMPEEKAYPEYFCKCGEPTEIENYANCQKCGKLLRKLHSNEIIRLCKLALLKKCEGIEEIILETEATSDTRDWGAELKTAGEIKELRDKNLKRIKEVAHAIRQEILGEKKEEER